MATGAIGEERPTLFLRKATGLVRGWSVRDSMIYACLSTNVVTLGLYEMSFSSAFPKGQLVTSVIISGIWVSFLVIAYAGLVVTIPRAGGDYVWQSRILGSGLGFVMAATGWWFILWLWAPIYGNILSVEFFQPLWATLGYPGQAAWFGTHNGVFVVTLITIVLAGLLVSIGMAGYAKVQKWCFYGGLVGFLVVVGLLLFSSHATFVSSFDSEAHKIFGISNAYAATNAGAAKLGFTAPSLSLGPIGPTMLLVPLMMFFMLWPNWGTTLYGEIRGASDFKRVFIGMFAGLWTTVILAVVFLLLFAKTFGWAFYQNGNALAANFKGVLPVWPYPVMLAGWLVNSTAFQVILILVMSLWFFGWVGTLFLSSTRVIFAAAFDRILPDGAAQVSEKRRVPVWSLMLMLAPAVGLAALYAYNTTFATYTLDATLVIAVTYVFSAVAVVVLPWRKPDLWQASPASRIKLLGVPVVPAAGVITLGLLGFNLYEWLSNSGYAVNNKGSLVYMGAMYVLAIAIYVGARVIRNRQGIDLGLINKEIPVE
ncbi:MAG: APC family permease [Streptosporangiaceae bacterium]|nr:APC family permease [Streptosporangiaceae bacterium]MBV9856924.1 APC family permease [Streptosporangiaceae bacterium]